MVEAMPGAAEHSSVKDDGVPKVAEPVREPQKEGAALLPSDASAAKAPARSAFREIHAKQLAVLFIMALLSILLLQAPWASESTSASLNQTTPPLAELMFNGYGASFVLLSLIMGVALIGGLFLAKDDSAEDAQKPESEPQEEKAAPSEATGRKVAAGVGGVKEKEGGKSTDVDGKGDDVA